MKTNKLFMKGVLAVALIILGAANMMAQVTPPDADFEVVQNKDGKTLTISDYKGTAKNISIPKTLYGLPVTVIGRQAFSKKGLTGVVIPNSVTSIGDDAFYNNDLASVTIPNSVTTIGNNAFYNNQLTNVTIPDSVIYLDGFNHNQLTSVTLGKNVTTIEVGAFSDNQLTSVTIPDSVTTIKAGAFSDNRLTSLILGKNVTTIESTSGAFENNQLTSVIIPDSVISIGTYAFKNNPLTSLTLGRGLTIIKEDAFSGNKLTSITIARDFPGINNNHFEQSFINFYESQGRSPGTYVKNGPIWSKKGNASADTSSSTNTFSATHRVATNDRTNLRLRNSPSTSGTQVTSLAYGTQVQVLETGAAFRDSDGNSGNWMRVRTQAGQEGWCFGAYLTKL